MTHEGQMALVVYVAAVIACWVATPAILRWANVTPRRRGVSLRRVVLALTLPAALGVLAVLIALCLCAAILTGVVDGVVGGVREVLRPVRRGGRPASDADNARGVSS